MTEGSLIAKYDMCETLRTLSLSSASARMKAILPLLPSKRRKEALKLGTRLQALRNEIEGLHLSAARKLRMKQAG
jgi:hypothetical protein